MPKKAAAPALAPAATKDLAPTNGDALFGHAAAAPAIATFEKVLGGRASLTADLLLSPDLTPPIRKVLTLILDPRFDTYPLAGLCHSAGLTPGDVFAAFRDATLAKANIRALRAVAERLVTITEHLLEDATDRQVICDDCTGSTQQLYPAKGKQPEQVGPCLRCNGTGTILLRADFEKQKIALELGGLLKKAPNVQVHSRNQTLNLTQHNQGGGGGIAQLQQAVSGMLFGRGFVADLSAEPVVEATVIEPVEGSA